MRAGLLGLMILATALFLALGAWQVERRAWKLDLIARVDRRMSDMPRPAPSRAEWPSVSREADEYRRVTVTGRPDPTRAAQVMAVTDLGPGFWLMMPVTTASGDTILVNQGFVPAGFTLPPAGDPVTVTGLLRMPEPGGGFLRANDPAADRWYSRDVAAIAAAHHLRPVAPFFVDADAAGNAPGRPVGGLTVVAFPNNHFVYALIWFALAAIAAFGAIQVVRVSESRP